MQTHLSADVKRTFPPFHGHLTHIFVLQAIEVLRRTQGSVSMTTIPTLQSSAMQNHSTKTAEPKSTDASHTSGKSSSSDKSGDKHKGKIQCKKVHANRQQKRTLRCRLRSFIANWCSAGKWWEWCTILRTTGSLCEVYRKMSKAFWCL